MKFLLIFMMLAITGCQQKNIISKVDLHVAKISDRYGYISHKGEIKINPQFEEALDFSEGFAVVALSGKKGFIANDGKYSINPQFEDAFSFSEGLAAVKVGGKWGYVDYKGKLIVNPQFDSAGMFVEGLAPVAIGDKYGYIEKDGKYKINPQFSGASEFSEGVAAVSIGNNLGYISKKGQFVINPQFSTAHPFKEGLACVAISSGNYGFINKKGEFVINPTYEYADSFSEKLAVVSMGGKYGYLDSAGKIIINYQFDHASSFDSGRALVIVNDIYSYIDTKGNKAINGTFDSAEKFTNGIARVFTGGKLHPLWQDIKGSTAKLIDESGKIIFTETGNSKTITTASSLDPDQVVSVMPTKLLNTPHVAKLLEEYIKGTGESLDGFQSNGYDRWNINGLNISCNLFKNTSYSQGYLSERAFVSIDTNNAEIELCKYSYGGVVDKLIIVSKVSNLDELREETKQWIMNNKGYQTKLKLITKNNKYKSDKNT